MIRYNNKHDVIHGTNEIWKMGIVRGWYDDNTEWYC